MIIGAFLLVMSTVYAGTAPYSFTQTSTCTVSSCTVTCASVNYDLTSLALSSETNQRVLFGNDTDASNAIKYLYPFTIPVCGVNPGTVNCGYYSSNPSTSTCDFSAHTVYQVSANAKYILGDYSASTWAIGTMTTPTFTSPALRFQTTPYTSGCSRSADVILYCDHSHTVSSPVIRNFEPTTCHYYIYVGFDTMCDIVSSPTKTPTLAPTSPTKRPTRSPTFAPTSRPTRAMPTKSPARCTRKSGDGTLSC